MNAAAYMAGPEINRLRNPALLIGIVALTTCVIAAFSSPAQFFRSYLLGFVFWIGLSLGCMAILMLQHLTGGDWGMVIRRPLESATRTLPLLAVLFLPVLFGMHRLYGWTEPGQITPEKAAYLNVRFFVIRAVIYFVVWLGLAYLLNKWSREQDRTSDPRLSVRLQLLSGPGLGLYVLTASFAGIDWIMSLEPRWYSTVFGLIVVGGQALSAIALIIAVLAWLSRREPMASVLLPRHFHDLGKLLLTFVMLWAYFAFSQLLVTWSGNLPEEIPWYLRRWSGAWGGIGVALILFHFALPFALLLSRDLKRSARALGILAVLIIFMRWVDLFWLTAPEFSAGSFQIHWMDLVAPIGLGGIWFAFFIWQLQSRPLLPIGDAQSAEALQHEKR